MAYVRGTVVVPPKSRSGAVVLAIAVVVGAGLLVLALTTYKTAAMALANRPTAETPVFVEKGVYVNGVRISPVGYIPPQNTHKPFREAVIFHPDAAFYQLSAPYRIELAREMVEDGQLPFWGDSLSKYWKWGGSNLDPYSEVRWAVRQGWNDERGTEVYSFEEIARLDRYPEVILMIFRDAQNRNDDVYAIELDRSPKQGKE